MKHWLCLVILLLTLAHSPELSYAESPNSIQYAHAQIATPSGVRLDVELADTEEKRHLGLGFRQGLSEGKGMLFIFEEKELHGFWMKNMRFPIDIIWLDNHKIVHIESDVPSPVSAQDLPVYKPSRMANMVLEIGAGQARKLGLITGQSLKYQFTP
ncbi:MAG: DUF192 domain-containing protein [SAR324 cluster bacterium]|nr:DUF192 domain-containing protein [SAR324 cluster bacterium]